MTASKIKGKTAGNMADYAGPGAAWNFDSSVPVRAPQTGDQLPIVWLWGLILAAGLLMSGYAGARLFRTKK